MPKTINPEKLVITYFKKNELDKLVHLLESSNQIQRFYPSRFGSLMIDQLRNSLDIRAILLYWPPHRMPSQESDDISLYYLYWSNGQNLEILDQKIEQNTFTDEDFRYSVVTRDNRTICFQCNSVWDTLVLESSWYFFERGLDRVKERQSPYECCPNCGKKFTIQVVKIFGLTPNQEQLKRELKLD